MPCVYRGNRIFYKKAILVIPSLNNFTNGFPETERINT